MPDDQRHPAISTSDWEVFAKQHSPFRFSEVIDRETINLPPWFAPFAKGVAIPCDIVLRRAGCCSRCTRPRGWQPSGADMFIHGEASNGMLVVRIGGLWSIGRNIDDTPDVLAFPSGTHRS